MDTEIKNITVPTVEPKKGNPIRSTYIIVWVILAIAIILLVLTAIIFRYSHAVQETIAGPFDIHLGIWSVFNTDALCENIVTNCSANNGSSAYGRCLFPFLGDRPYRITGLSPTQQMQHLVGAHPMSYNDAIVIFGQIPRNRPYWGITGYLYSVPSTVKNQRLVVAASVGDSIDSGNTFSQNENDYLALVYSPNPNMLSYVQRQWNASPRLFPAGSSDWSIQWKMLPIPSNMYGTEYDYCLFTRILQTEYNDTVPTWQCYWFTARGTSVPAPTIPVAAMIEGRSTVPNEITNFFSGDVKNWYNAAYQRAKAFYPADGDLVTTYLGKTIPFLSWVPGMCTDAYDCGLRCGCQGLLYGQNLRYDNDSTIYYICAPITVPKGKALYVVALNHVASKSALAYSNLTFTNLKTETAWLGVITGLNDPNDPEVKNGLWPPQDPTETIVDVKVKVPPELFGTDGTASVLITERAYLNANGSSIWYSAVAPAQVFLVNESDIDPAEFTTDYQWNV